MRELNTRQAIDPATCCARCRGPLAIVDWVALRCVPCGVDYPLLDGALPLLVAEPDSYVAQAVVQMRSALQQLEHDAGIFTAAIDGGSRRAGALTRARDGYFANMAVLQQLIETLRPYLSIDALLQARSDALTDYDNDFLKISRYVRRDWSGAPETELEILATEQALQRALDASGGARDAALVLGAGLGRFAFDLQRQFRWAYASDYSFLMAGMFHLLEQRGGLVLHDSRLINKIASGQQGEAFAVRVPPRAGNFRYVVADARRLPFPDRSLSTVASIYFTDVLPLSTWLGEVARVLAPGGTFIHFGPLHYHHAALDEQYAAEELPEALRAFGFEIVASEWVLNSMTRDASLDLQIFNNLCFAAVLR